MEELQKKKVSELYQIVKDRGIKKTSKLRKPELIEVLSNIPEVMEEMHNLQKQRIILDEPIPKINAKILKPSKPKPIKNLESKVAKPLMEDINEFTDWILSYVPEPSKKIVDERIESMKEKFNKIFKRLNQKENSNEKANQIRKRFAPKESLKEKFNRTFKKPTTEYEEKEEDFTPKKQKRELKGYLKSYKIDGRKGYDSKTFINKIKQKVTDLINQKKKPVKVKFILTCKLVKKSLLLNKIEEEVEKFFHSPTEIISEASDLSKLFDDMTDHILRGV